MKLLISIVMALILTFGFLFFVMSNGTKTGYAERDTVKIVVAEEAVRIPLVEHVRDCYIFKVPAQDWATACIWNGSKYGSSEKICNTASEE